MNLFGSENQLAYTRNCTELQERAKPTYMGLFLPFSTLIWLAKVRIVQPHLSRKRLLFSLVVNAPDESVSFYTFCRSQQVQAMNVFLFSAFHSHPRLFVQIITNGCSFPTVTGILHPLRMATNQQYVRLLDLRCRARRLVPFFCADLGHRYQRFRFHTGFSGGTDCSITFILLSKHSRVYRLTSPVAIYT